MTREEFAEEVLTKIREHIDGFKNMRASWDRDGRTQGYELFKINWDLKDGSRIYNKLQHAPGVSHCLKKMIGVMLREISEVYARKYGTINLENKFPIAFEFPEENPETEQCKALYLLAESLLEEPVAA